MNILAEIVAVKKKEIQALYEQHRVADLLDSCIKKQAGEEAETPLFYQALQQARASGQAFFVSEFKRKSPSEGWINQHADLPAQVHAYTRAGAGAISVLTDSSFFGGSYADLQVAAETLHATAGTQRPLLLQKDFILDPIQIYLARLGGADIILLIAAILEADELEALKKTAETLGMGVLVEVHDQEELDKIRHLDFPVLGINNRDLKTFRTALNRVNVLRKQGEQRFIISESGIRDAVDFQWVQAADGFLIGTGLMRQSKQLQQASGERFSDFFQSSGKLLFKACGIRTPELLHSTLPDFLGINFSPVSKRRATPALLEKLKEQPVFNPHWVAVFYKNTEAEILETLALFPFQTVQVYAGDLRPEFLRRLKCRVLLALSIRRAEDLETIGQFAADVDGFILDGAAPGSGQSIEAEIPIDFPYPFLLAGGMNAANLERCRLYQNCIGVDVASGIEVGGAVDETAIKNISGRLAEF